MTEPHEEKTAMEQITTRLDTLENLVESAAAADPAKAEAAIEKAVSMQENLAQEIGQIKEQLGTFSGSAEELKRIRADLTEAANQHTSLSGIVKKLVEGENDGEGNPRSKGKRRPASTEGDSLGFPYIRRSR